MCAFSPFGEGERDRYVSRADEELWTVVGHEWRVAAALVFCQDLSNERWCAAFTHVDVGLESLDTLDRARDHQDLTTSDLLSLDTSQERTHVVARLAAVELFVEHFYPSARETHATHQFQ